MSVTTPDRIDAELVQQELIGIAQDRQVDACIRRPTRAARRGVSPALL